MKKYQGNNKMEEALTLTSQKQDCWEPVPSACA